MRNYEKGMPIGRFLQSALRHTFQYIEGYRDEDHLAQAAWNLMSAIHIDEMIERGMLPKELRNTPSYLEEQKPTDTVPKPRVSLDIDDVLTKTIVDVLKILEEKTGRKHVKTDIKGWNLDGLTDGTEVTVKDLFGWVWSNDHWVDIEPESEDITKLVNELSELADVSIVTSASPSQVEGKMKWLEMHGIELPIIAVPYGKTKEDLHFEAYIDDRPETIERAVAKGKLGILYNQPWNQAVKEGPRLIRVNTLREAIDALKKWAQRPDL